MAAPEAIKTTEKRSDGSTVSPEELSRYGARCGHEMRANIPSSRNMNAEDALLKFVLEFIFDWSEVEYICDNSKPFREPIYIKDGSGDQTTIFFH